jgi:lipopolysaccharide/colanic/teichoic acid biosynthesis glycosyltransferase
MPGKRLFDVAASGVLLFLLLPVFAAVAAAIKLSDRGSAFYTQERVGRDGRPFKMWKFRSMVTGADQMVEEHQDANVNNGLLFKLQDDPRITPVGGWLRRLSLDELPQLCNVLRGDMSFVGPRPLPVDPGAFDEVALKRHSVRPGITGPWQVHGGHALSYEDMVSLDLAYITGWSFRHDLWLLALTLPALVVRRAPVV